LGIKESNAGFEATEKVAKNFTPKSSRDFFPKEGK
jgi:hypothetical protein